MTTDGAGRVRGQAQGAKLHAQGIDQQQAPAEGLPGAGEDLKGLRSLDGADDADQGGEDAIIGAGRVLLAFPGVETLVAGAAGGAGEDDDLALGADGGAGDQGDAVLVTGGVDREAGGEVVAAVHNCVDPGEQGRQLLGVDDVGMALDLDLRIEGGEGLAGGFDLGQAQAGGVVEDLALEVAQVHPIEVRHP